MAWKAVVPLALFGAVFLGSISFIVSSMSESTLDSHFYEDLSLVSKFKEQKDRPLFSKEIVSDSLGARNYLFNNSLNLIWEANDGNQSSSRVIGNAFLLNVMLPDWIDEYHPDRNNYSPIGYLGGDEIVLLLGTSFSFVKQLFDKVSDWKTDVNDSSSSPNLEEKSNNSYSNSFYISHPWPIMDPQQGIINQKYLYKLGDSNYSSFERDVENPYYFKVDNKNVEAVYVAVDLSVNRSLIDFDLRFKNRASRILNRGLHNPNYVSNSVDWAEDIQDINGQKYNFAVDFAVLKVKFNIANLKKHYIDYLVALYKKVVKLPQILRTELVVRDRKTDSLFVGGWESLSEKETDMLTMQNLFVFASIKKDKLSEASDKAPSEYVVEESKFNGCCDIDLYETYTQRLSSLDNNPKKSNNYEVVDSKYYPNDADGVLVVEYRIKNKNKSWISNHKKQVFITGFKSSANSSNPSQELTNQMNNIAIANKKLVSFLEAKPKAYASWKEFGIDYSYFPYKNIKQLLLEKTLFSGKEETFNSSSPLSLFTLGDKKYLNIAHHLDIPNMDLGKGKGTVAVMKHPNKYEKVLLGMYDGTRTWDNPISNTTRNVGKIAMFISPWRYDLFNENNKLSKPSLGDVLKKKDLQKKIVQVNRFNLSAK